MGRIKLKEETFQEWVKDHVIEDRYVVFFDRTGLRIVFWVLPATRTWQFATLTLADDPSREKLEQLLKNKGVKFFVADVDWGLGKVKFWSWKAFSAFCQYYLPDRSYEGYHTESEEIILLPKVSSKNLIKFCIELTRTNKPETITPESFLNRLKIQVYSVDDYTWSAEMAQAAPAN